MATFMRRILPVLSFVMTTTLLLLLTGRLIIPDLPLVMNSAGLVWYTLDGENVKILSQIAVSVAMFPVGFYLALSKKYEPKDKYWAYGSLLAIIGFWLKALVSN